MPSRRSPKPKAQAISVAEGRNETIRRVSTIIMRPKQAEPVPTEAAQANPSPQLSHSAPLTTIEDLMPKAGPFPANSAKQATLTIRCMVGSEGSGRRPKTRAANSRQVEAMSDEQKSPAEL